MKNQISKKPLAKIFIENLIRVLFGCSILFLFLDFLLNAICGEQRRNWFFQACQLHR